jgi:hypothetical protein
VKDLVKLIFFIIDREKTGLIDNQGLKHLLLTLWDGQATINCLEAINRLSRYENSFGQVTFEKLQQWVKTYPAAYYPVFRLQTAIMRRSFGEEFWNGIIATLQEKEEKRKRLEEMGPAEKSRLRAEQLVREKEQMVYSQMGSAKYFLLFWKRKYVRARIADVVVNFSKTDQRNADILFCFDKD